jgi:hypothetical protein
MDKGSTRLPPTRVEREGQTQTPPPSRAIPTTCIEHQAGRQSIRLSFQIKVF